MELNAFPKTIQDILAAQKVYKIPRFQREFSWEKEELLVLWSDILSSLELEGNILKPSDYFIGSLVLVGNDHSEELEVVDGQQRLTTISLILVALEKAFLSAGDKEVAEGTRNYFEGKDKDGQKYFKLKNDAVSPFIQRRIFSDDPMEDVGPDSAEEKRVLDAYTFFSSRLSQASLLKSFSDRGIEIDESDPIAALKAVRDQVLNFKTIYITVTQQRFANKIFETLNAKGKELETIDLIKNEIFRIMNSTHPADEAQIAWGNIKSNLAERGNGADFPIFFRYYWISRKKYIAQNKIYSAFSNEYSDNGKGVPEFLKELEFSSEIYKKLFAPQVADWPEVERKQIYRSLKSIDSFRVISPRIFLLPLFELHKKKIVKLAQVKYVLSFIEDFHFVFSAVTSSRASGLDRRYSKYAQKLIGIDKSDVQKVITGLKADLSEALPGKAAFIESFDELRFTKKNDKHKPIFQYIFRRYEQHLAGSDELEINNFSLDHIHDESYGSAISGKVGNILPIKKEINEELPKEFPAKLPYYRDSAFKTTKSFFECHEKTKSWNDEKINARTKEIAEKFYDEIISIE
jgi:uncharacterized protein with ParB-like and HNH nuclease domain